jgi:hypothetical protein
MNIGQDRSADQAQPPAPQEVHFTLGVEQHGRRIPVQGHHVTLDKAPFRFVFYFEQLGPMLVQASYGSTIYNQAARNVPLDQLLRPDAAVVENLMNPRGLLYVDEGGVYHNWLYLGPQTHRFDADEGVVAVPEGGYLCRRTVRNLVVDGQAIPVEKSPGNTIYCVFVKTTRSGGHQRVEKQRDWLELRFR